MLHADTDDLAYNTFLASENGETHHIDSLRQALLYLYNERQYRHQDAVNEASALLAREALARLHFEPDIAAVLPPYDLDAHLAAGDFEHDPTFLQDVDARDMAVYLNSLPKNLDIFTPTPRTLRAMHPNPHVRTGLARNPAYELPSQRLEKPYAELTPYQQMTVWQDVVYEVLNELLGVHADGYLREVATAMITPDSELNIDFLRGILQSVRNLRRQSVPLAAVRVGLQEAEAAQQPLPRSPR
jgi:hypothetical protein